MIARIVKAKRTPTKPPRPPRVRPPVRATGRTFLYANVAEALRRRIVDGLYEAGHPIPTEGALVQEFGVSPITVRRALRELTFEGMLFGRQGLGVFVAEPSNDLTKTARRKKLLDLIDALLTEAVYLGLSGSDVITAVTERTRHFEWQPAGATGGKS